MGSARKSGAVAAETPPVGQNVTSGNGPANALSMPMPPACCAGNSFSSLKPAARAAITSDGVITPGSNGNALSLAADASAGVSPGLTPNTAPALIDSSKSSGRVIVPTPTIAPSTSRAMASMACSATGVRSVSSSTRTPPATSALASGTACSIFSTTMTGMTGPMRMISRTFIATFPFAKTK